LRKAITQPQRANSVAAKGFAVNEKQVKLRMKSVTSIEKITKAMKMVAASKMRADLARLEAGKSFGYNSVNMMFKCDTYMQKRAPHEATNPSVFIVPITTDRGLCGGINSTIVREIKSMMPSLNRSSTKVFVIGEKGTMALIRHFPDLISNSVSDISHPLNYPSVMAVADQIKASSDKHDKILIIYNEFKSAISTIVRKMELIPKKRFTETFRYQKLYNLTRPDPSTAVPAIYDLYLSSNLYHALLNNAASEQSARMTAMENASKNAKEIIEKLRLVYNKARQARITMELVEIISGASAL